jgi:glycosyltransferase involved in cell wall biosynthesis
MSTTKVCYVVESFSGGVFNLIKDSVKALQDEYGQEFTFTIIYSIRDDIPDAFEQYFKNVTFIHLQMGSRAIERSDIQVIFKLRQLLLQQKVIHLHSSRAGFLGRLAIATLWTKPKSYYSPHSFAFLNLEFSLLKRKLIWLVEYILANLTKTSFVASGPTEYELAFHLSRQTLLVTNGIDQPEHCHNINLEKNKKAQKKFFRVAGCGRNCLQKDPDFFISIAREFKDESIEFKWIGDIDNPKYATGWVPRDDVFTLLDHSDIYLATSLWEGLPINGLEAMHLKKPLIVRRTSSFIDLVEHGKNGYIFDSVPEAVSYIKALKSDPELLITMGESSKNIALDKFSIKNYLKLASLYRS